MEVVTRMNKKAVSGFDYLWCALYACAGFAFELLLVQIEKCMGINIGEYKAAQNIIHWLITTVGWVAIGLLVGIANKHDFVIGVLAHSGAKLLVFVASNLTGFLVEGLGEGQGVVGEVDGDVGFSHSFSRFLAVGRDPFFCFGSEVCCFCFPHFLWPKYSKYALPVGG